MKALSLHQPYASALFIPGFKAIETRSWRLPPSMLGKTILIHAAKAQLDYPLKLWIDVMVQMKVDRMEDLPYGALLGVATVISCARTEMLIDHISETELSWGNYSDGRFGWSFRDALPFDKPISYRGQQGIFNVPEELVLHR